MRKRLWGILVCLCIVFLLPCIATAAETESGTWGGIDWTLTADGTLTIAPTTGTPAADKNTTKWTWEVGQWREAVIYTSAGGAKDIGGWPYDRSKVKKVIIEEGVTSIGSFALQSHTNLTGEVVIPSTVTYIGQEAFQKSTMTKLTFAKGGTDELCIAQGAFKNLLVEELALPDDRPVHIHAWSFLNSAKLKHLTLPATLTSITGTNHVDYNHNANAQTGGNSSSSAILNNSNTSIETVTFGSEEVKEMFFDPGKSNTLSSVACVGLTYCTSLEAAAEHAQSGDTITLLKNSSEDVVLPEGVVLDANGKEYNGTVYYKVTFLDYDQSIIQTEDLEYGADIVAPEDPVRASTAQYTYTFAGWDEEVADTVTSTVTYTATYNRTANPYTITFDTDGGTDVSPITQGYNTAVVAPTAPTKTGYTFAGWDQDIPSTMPAEDMTITATWTINEYTISFDVDGGSAVAAITQDYNTAVVAPAAPTKTGYTFAGWDQDIPAAMPAENVTIKALWTANEYTITFDSNGGSAVDAMTQDYGTAVVAPAAPTKTGYTFAGWDQDIPSTMPAEDMTITAQWTINEYTIAFDTDGGSAVAAITQDYNTAVVAPAAPTKTGYTFAGWDQDIPSTMPAEDMTITAQWTINEYTIAFDTDGGSAVAAITQDYGTAVVVPAAPTKTGYTFAGWDQDIPSTMPAEDMTITATWTINEYTISFDVDGGSAVAAITQDYNTAVVAPANPTKTGYTFAGWDQDIPAAMPAENVTIKALWTANEYTITFDSNGGSAVDAMTQDYGTAVVAPAAPTKTGYTFAGWDQDIPSTMPAEDMTITAQWTINEYTITFDVDGGSAVDAITQDYGTAVVAPAAPTKTGYTFAGWDQDIPSTMPAEDMTITAQWTINEYTITFDVDGGSVVDAITQDYGTAVVAPAAPTKTGYTFAGWDQDIPSTMPAEDMTITAKWDPATDTAYTVQYYHQNTSGDGYTLCEEETLRGTTDTETAAVAKDYPGFTALNFAQIAILPDGSAIVTIKYDRNIYDITLVPGEGAIGEGNVTEYTYGVGAVLPTDVTRKGYSFEGWYDDEEYTGSPVVDITVSDLGDKVFYAKWEIVYTPAEPTYAPKLLVGEGGNAKLSTTSPANAAAVFVYVDPDPGKMISSVVVTDKNGVSVNVTEVGNGTYRFTQPVGSVTIKVSFAESVYADQDFSVADCPKDGSCLTDAYTDLDVSGWYHDGIHFCLDKGLMNGTSASTFAPGMTTSRAMIVTILWRLEGQPVVDQDASFEDVASGSWYSDAVRWAASKGLVNGYSNGDFGPNDAISREQFSAILYRYEHYKSGTVTAPEKDPMDYNDLADVSSWAYDAMGWMSQSGIVSGKPGNLLDPKGSATRAEAATMLYRYYEAFEQEQ